MLPEEVLLQIFSFCDILSLVNLNLVCKKFHELINDNLLWKNKYQLNFNNLISTEYQNSFKTYFKNEYNLFKNWCEFRCKDKSINFQRFIRSFSYHDNIIYSGFFNGNIGYYNLLTNEIKKLTAHLDQVIAIDVDKDFLISGSGPPYWLDRESVDLTL